MKQKLYFLIFFLVNLNMFSQNATHLNFDGVNDYVVANSSNLPLGNSSRTVEFWVKTAQVSGSYTLFSYGNFADNKRIALVNAGGKLYFSAYFNDYNTNITIADNNWHHVAFTFDGASKIYLDGVLIATPTLNAFATAGTQIILGAGNISLYQPFAGNLDEVRIWNTARTAGQINGSKNCELQGTETGLVAYYKFNQGIAAGNNSSQTTLTATNGPNGTLNGFALTGTSSNWVGGSPVFSNAPSVTTPVVYIQGDIASPLTATSGGTGLLWYTTATGGTGDPTAPTPSTASVGSTTYWVSSSAANGCESQRVQIIVNVIASVPATHLNFDGVNDYVVANSSNLPLGNSSRTVEFWVKTAQVSGSYTLFSYGNFADNKRIALLNAGGKLYFSAYFNDYNTNITIADNNWHHVAFTFDGASKIYLDGVLIATPTLNAFATAGTQIILGAGNISLYQPFAGNLDEVRIWNTARTADQINGSKNCELQGTETGLVAYYKFNQGLDTANNAGITTLTATTGANGTLNNFALTGTTSNWLAGSPVTTGIVVPSVATVTTPVVYNQGATASPLSATSGGTGLLWYTSATGGTGSATAPTPSTATVGTTSYWVSSTNANGCESTRTTVSVIVSPTEPTALATQVYAGTGTIASLTATATGTLNWYNVATGGTALATTTALVNDATYYVSQTQNGSESTRTAVIVHKISEATQTFCEPATIASLVSTPSTGTIANWFTTATSGSAMTSTNTITTGTYYVEQTTTTTIENLGSGFSHATGVAIQSDGKIVVVDIGNSAIKRMNADGSGIEILGSGFYHPYGVAIQSDGKIVVADYGNSAIKRMNADGSGIEILGGGFSNPSGVAIQSDGKIVVADYGNSAIKRMNADGSGIEILGSGFYYPSGVAIQSDGKIVVADYGNSAIKRMNADGSGMEILGSGFYYPTGVAIQSDGKIVVADSYNSLIKRMNADGSGIEILGSGFYYPSGVAIQSDGKIVVADNGNSAIKRITEASTSNRVAVVVTVNPTPSAPTAADVTYIQGATASPLSATSGGTGLLWYTSATGGTGSATAPTPSTAIGGTTSYWVSSTNVNGCESTRTTVSVIVSPTEPTALATQVYAGTGTIASLTATATGTLNWYDVATGGTALATTTALVNDATYYVSQTQNGIESTRTAVIVHKISEATQTFCEPATIASLVSTPSTGTIANWFTTATSGSAMASTNTITTGTYYVEQTTTTTIETLGSGYNRPTGVAIQSDGKIVVADFANSKIKRMNADGSGIVTLGSGFSNPYGVAIQSDGKIVVADYGNSAIKRMNADGSGIEILGGGFSNPHGVAIQSDGKIVVADYNNSLIKRMNADGSDIEPLGSGFNHPTGVAIQSDGKIVVADYNNSLIKRMNADGSGIIEPLGSGFYRPIGVAIQSDGKIVVADTYNHAIKRMNADGSGIVTIASGFSYPTGVAIQSDGKIVVADYGNNAIKRITEASTSNRVAVVVTVNPTPSAPTASAQSFCASGTVANLVATGSGGTLNWYNVATGGTPLASSTELSTGTYYVSETNANGCESERTTVEVTINTLITFYLDADNDGYGNEEIVLMSCSPVEGYVTIAGDCNDSNPAVNPGATEICYDGIDNDCDGIIDDGCIPIVSVVQATQCGMTLAAINSYIYANDVAGAQGYRFRVTDMSTMQVQTIDKALRVFALTQLANYKFDTTYQIEVLVKKFNVWQPFYGAPCTVTTPATTTQVQSSQCGTTLTTMSNVIYANIVSFATGYRFKATNLVTNDVQIVDRPLRDFRMNLLTSPSFGTTYSIEVAVRNTDGTYLPYGPICNVTTPIFPTTSLQDSQCDYTASSNTETIYATSYSGATTYRFKFENTGLGYTYTFDRPLRSFALNTVPGLMPATTYSVQVSIELNGEFGPYGKVCTLTTPGGIPARTIENTIVFKATAYPNPYDNAFNLDVTTSTDEVIELRVYDMIGKLIETRKVDVSSINTVQIGERYPSGVYNVIVSQGNQSQNVRVIKR